jgi:hypothetical protein
LIRLVFLLVFYFSMGLWYRICHGDLLRLECRWIYGPFYEEGLFSKVVVVLRGFGGRHVGGNRFPSADTRGFYIIVTLSDLCLFVELQSQLFGFFRQSSAMIIAEDVHDW